MNLEEMFATAKDLADDPIESGVWTLELATVYANEGEVQACRRGRLIVDSTTVADSDKPAKPLCVHAVTAGTSLITLNKRVIFVRRVKLASNPIPLTPTHLRDMDRIFPGWEDAEAGQPMTYIPNWQQGKLRFHRPFEDDDTVRLTVVRTPLRPMEDEDHEPEIEERHHLGLVYWMLYRFFSKPDPDTKDKVKASDYLKLFENEFGPASSAVTEQWIAHEQVYDPDAGVF